MLYQTLKPHLFLLEVFQERSEVIGPLRRVLGTWGRQVERGSSPGSWRAQPTARLKPQKLHRSDRLPHIHPSSPTSTLRQ